MKKFVITACALALAFTPSAMSAQIDVGAQGNWGEDVDFGVGGRVVVGLPVQAVSLQAIGEFNYYFPDGFDYWEANGNLVYAITVPNSPATPYVGGGINIAHVEVEVLGQSASDTEVGLNLLGGVRFEAAPKITPYAEAKYEVQGGEQFFVTAGVAFNVGPGM